MASPLPSCGFPRICQFCGFQLWKKVLFCQLSEHIFLLLAVNCLLIITVLFTKLGYTRQVTRARNTLRIMGHFLTVIADFLHIIRFRRTLLDARDVCVYAAEDSLAMWYLRGASAWMKQDRYSSVPWLQLALAGCPSLRCGDGADFHFRYASRCIFYLTHNTVPPNFMYKQKLYSDSLCEILRDVWVRCAVGQRPNWLRYASVVLVSVEMCSFCFGLASKYVYWSRLSDRHETWELVPLFHEILSCINCTYPFTTYCLCICMLQRLQDERNFVSGLILCMPYLPVPYLSTGILAPQIVP